MFRDRLCATTFRYFFYLTQKKTGNKSGSGLFFFTKFKNGRPGKKRSGNYHQNSKIGLQEKKKVPDFFLLNRLQTPPAKKERLVIILACTVLRISSLLLTILSTSFAGASFNKHLASSIWTFCTFWSCFARFLNRDILQWFRRLRCLSW